MNSDTALPGGSLPIRGARPEDSSPLRALVEGEARRTVLEGRIAPDPQRIAAGWSCRFVADAMRATEMMELYRQLGYETVADPVRVEDVDEGCGDCRLLASRRLMLIYTRRGGAPPGA